MWLVLCSSDDPAGVWAYLGLRRRGLAPLELVSCELLGWALTWRHRIGRDGVDTEIGLGDGRHITGAAVRGVFSRFQGVTAGATAAFREEDRSYVAQELHALHLSWLASLTVPVLNPPVPFSLAGARPSAPEWSMLAAQAGLATSPHRSDCEGGLLAARRATRSLLVLGERVLSTSGVRAPAQVVAGVQRLARRAGLRIAEVGFAPTPRHPWTFVGADPLPDLRRWGEEALDALHEALREDRTPVRGSMHATDASALPPQPRRAVP